MPLLQQLGWRHMYDGVSHSDMSAEKLKDLQITPREILRQFEKIQLCGKNTVNIIFKWMIFHLGSFCISLYSSKYQPLYQRKTFLSKAQLCRLP